MNRLQERRLALGLRQTQVSARLKEVEARADAGVVSRYENGVCLPTPEQMKRLEDILQAGRLELFDAEDLDLLAPAGYPDEAGADHPPRRSREPPSHVGRLRKCYRISREFAESLPDDLLQVCGYSSWQSWHDAAKKRLLAEYAARKRAGKKSAGPPRKPSASGFRGERTSNGMARMPAARRAERKGVCEDE